MERWWPLRTLQRIAYVGAVAMMPLRLLALVLEIAAAAIAIGAVVLLVGVYTHRIPDSTTAWFLDSVGGRVFDVLRTQGVF